MHMRIASLALLSLALIACGGTSTATLVPTLTANPVPTQTSGTPQPQGSATPATPSAVATPTMMATVAATPTQASTPETATARPAASPTAAAKEVTPLPDMAGQTVTFAGQYSKGTFDCVVQSAEENISLTYRRADYPPTGKFVAVYLSCTNNDTETAAVGLFSFSLRDNQNRLFRFADPEAQVSAGNKYDKEIIHTEVEPGVPTEFVFVFDVPTDASGFRVVKDD
jgi:hypothetical protein